MKSSRKIEPLRLSSKVKQELSASGVFTAAGANAILQKVVVEAESAEAVTSRKKSDFSASINSMNILDDDDEEQATPTTEKSVMGKLNASFTNFFMSSIEGLRDELDSSNLAERHGEAKERNIAPKRASVTFHKERTTRTDKKSHRCGEVKW